MDAIKLHCNNREDLRPGDGQRELLAKRENFVNMKLKTILIKIVAFFIKDIYFNNLIFTVTLR